jgi:hypothetical protein
MHSQAYLCVKQDVLINNKCRHFIQSLISVLNVFLRAAFNSIWCSHNSTYLFLAAVNGISKGMYCSGPSNCMLQGQGRSAHSLPRGSKLPVHLHLFYATTTVLSSLALAPLFVLQCCTILLWLWSMQFGGGYCKDTIRYLNSISI